MKHIPSQTLRMNPHQRRPESWSYIANLQNYCLFRLRGPNALKSKYAKVAKAAGEIGFRNLFQLQLLCIRGVQASIIMEAAN